MYILWPNNGLCNFKSTNIKKLDYKEYSDFSAPSMSSNSVSEVNTQSLSESGPPSFAYTKLEMEQARMNQLNVYKISPGASSSSRTGTESVNRISDNQISS